MYTDMLWWFLIFLVNSSLLLGMCTVAAEPRQWSAQSGPQTVALVELYTSEGCNSCPPADTWLSSLSQHGFSRERLVALGLHVDYWDYLGWPDRFAQATFTERQRAIAARQRSRTIYTPQVVVQGEDFRRWNTLESVVQHINKTPARAQVQVQVTSPQPHTLEVRANATVLPAAEQRQAQMYVALYHRNLQSRVTAGENAGHTLQHDFVVRQWLGPFELDAHGKTQVQRTLQLERDWQLANLGVVAFVQHPHTGEVLQALALPLE